MPLRSDMYFMTQRRTHGRVLKIKRFKLTSGQPSYSSKCVKLRRSNIILLEVHNMINQTQRQQLKTLSLFQSVSDETLNTILAASKKVTYKKNSYVFHDQEELQHVFIVLSGKLSMYKMGENGQKRIVFILDRGHILNDDITAQHLSSINCHVFEESLLLVCPKDVFITQLSVDFSLTKAVLEQYTQKLRRTYRQLKNSPASLSIEKKVAAKLVKLAYDFGQTHPSGTRIELHLSVTYLADMLSAQRETVSRALKKLVQEELIMYEDKTIIIHDVKKLSTFFKTQL